MNKQSDSFSDKSAKYSISPPRNNGLHKLEDTYWNVYKFARDYIIERQYSPASREIGLACFMTHPTAQRHLDKLEAWGYISREPHIPRSIVILIWLDDEKNVIKVID